MCLCKWRRSDVMWRYKTGSTWCHIITAPTESNLIILSIRFIHAYIGANCLKFPFKDMHLTCRLHNDDWFIRKSVYTDCNYVWFSVTIGNTKRFPDSKAHGANTWPTWDPWAPDGPHVGPMNLAIRVFHTRHEIHKPMFHVHVSWYWQHLVSEIINM